MHPEVCSLPQNQNRWTKLLASCNSRRKKRRSALAAAERKPWLQRARRERSKPSGVRGPVLAPPCIRQRPLRIAGARHFSPCRVLAPHRGAVFGSPGGLPFFSHPDPLLRSRFLFFGFIVAAHVSGIVLAHLAHDGLTAFMDLHVFYDHFLFAFASITA